MGFQWTFMDFPCNLIISRIVLSANRRSGHFYGRSSSYRKLFGSCKQRIFPPIKSNIFASICGDCVYVLTNQRLAVWSIFTSRRKRFDSKRIHFEWLFIVWLCFSSGKWIFWIISRESDLLVWFHSIWPHFSEELRSLAGRQTAVKLCESASVFWSISTWSSTFIFVRWCEDCESKCEHHGASTGTVGSFKAHNEPSLSLSFFGGAPLASLTVGKEREVSDLWRCTHLEHFLRLAPFLVPCAAADLSFLLLFFL